MIANVLNVKDYLQECLKNDKSAYEYSKILFTWPYSGFECETSNDYARLECIKWMLERISDNSYVNKSFIYATWFMIREVTMNLKTLTTIWSENKTQLTEQLYNDFKEMYEYDPFEYSKCLNNEGYSSLHNSMSEIISKVSSVNDNIIDEKCCPYYIDKYN